MKEIIKFMIQVFKEQKTQITSAQAIEYYFEHKQLPFGKQATTSQLNEAIVILWLNNTIEKIENGYIYKVVA